MQAARARSLAVDMVPTRHAAGTACRAAWARRMFRRAAGAQILATIMVSSTGLSLLHKTRRDVFIFWL